MPRPRTIEEMQHVLSRFRTREAWEKGVNLPVRPDDVFIATYPKCGTTWVQQIVHQLRSYGSMDFDEISRVVPWLESAWDMGIDPAADQAWKPRAFKSHFHWDELPKGGRYIHVTRNPVDVLRSFYQFFEGWFFEAGSISIDSFAREFFVTGSRSGRYWSHVLAWWPQRANPDVLLLAYENMADDPPAAVARIAEFIGLDDAARVAVATENSSRRFMAAHASQFDEHLMRQARDHIWGLPPGGESLKVRREGTDPTVPGEIAELLSSIWAREVEPVLGLAGYTQLRNELDNAKGGP